MLVRRRIAVQQNQKEGGSEERSQLRLFFTESPYASEKAIKQKT